MAQAPGRTGRSIATPPVSGLSPSRLEQLRRDLELTPEERVLAAEETLRLDKLRSPGGPRQVLCFDRYEDYLDYKFRASTGRD